MERLDSIPWPEASDSFFAHSFDWRSDAVVESVAGDWDAYVLGYKRGADLLTDAAISAGNQQELLVLPILFLYRHYVEIQLKRLLTEGRALLDQEPGFPEIHMLKDLWRACRPVLERVFPEAASKDTPVVTRLIDELHSIDPLSFTFRYPVGKSGQVTLPPALRRLNIRNVRDVMEKLESFFDGAATGIAVYLDQKRDLEDAGA